MSDKKLYLRMYNKRTSAPDTFDLIHPYEQHIIFKERVQRLKELVREGFITLETYKYDTEWKYLEIVFTMHKEWCMTYIMSARVREIISIQDVINLFKLELQIPSRLNDNRYIGKR